MTEPFLSSFLPQPGHKRLALALALLVCLASAMAPVAPARAEPGAQAARVATAQVAAQRLAARNEALARANAAVVGVDAVAIEDASSVATLGRSRQGSGVVIGSDGLVLTIGYLILEADHVDLVLDNGRRVPARVVAYDVASGLGLLQGLAPLALAPAPLGASAAVRGDEPLLVASGGDEGDLSVARMVSRRPFSGYWEYHIEGALFTAPARFDHSGAGLFNANGELVGIGSLVVADASGGSVAPAERGNMFVPVDLLKPVLASLHAGRAPHLTTRAWLGLNCVEIGGHVRVVRLAAESPAEDAGLQPGDLILAIDGTPVNDLASMYRTLWRDERAEREVSIDVARGGELMRLNARAVDRMKTLSRPRGV